MSDTGVVSPMTPISVPSESSQQASDDGAVAQAPTTTADPRTTELAAMVVRHVPELSLGRLRRSLTRRMALVPFRDRPRSAGRSHGRSARSGR